MRKEETCGITNLFCLLSGKWTLPVLYQLHRASGPLRFGELLRAVGTITQKELTRSLRTLEEMGLVSRTQYPEIPPRVEYRTTELGESLKEPLEGLARWLRDHPLGSNAS